MPESIRIQDMMPDEIAELLLARDCDLTEEQARAVHEFIEHIGGIENAFDAVALLNQLERSA